MVAPGAAPGFLDANTHQGYFAEGMVAAIAAAAGLDVLWPRLGNRIDMTVFAPGPNGTSGSRQATLQIKSWSIPTVADEDGNYHYPLGVPAFNYLAGSNHDVRHYLVLCLVPAEATAYAYAQEADLTLRRSAYWLSLREMEPDPGLNPDSTKTVLVPRRHLLTPHTIAALVQGDEAAAVVQ